MNKFYEILLISTSVVGFYVSFVLLFLAKQNRLLNRLLSFYTLTCSIFFLLIYSAIRSWGSEPLVAIRTFCPILLITPALGYLYFRALLEDETRLTRKDIIHLLPLILNIIYFLPLLLTRPKRWSVMVSDMDPEALFINPGPLPDEVIILFRMTVTFFYVVSVIRFFYVKKSFVKGVQKQQAYSKSKTWILIVLAGHVFFGISIIINQARAFYSEYPPGLSYGGGSATIALLGLDLIIIYAIVNPEILFGIPQFVRPISEPPAAGNPATEQPSSGVASGSIVVASIKKAATEKVIEHEAPEKHDKKSAKPAAVSIPAEEKETNVSEAVKLLVERIHAHVAQHQPYRNQEFNIASLSAALGAPQHHIAFIFRQVLHQSFVEYRNRLRVEYVKESIRSGAHKQITIEAIGTDAGFSSRATFFAVFKDLTGMTPGQFAGEYTSHEIDAQAETPMK